MQPPCYSKAAFLLPKNYPVNKDNQFEYCVFQRLLDALLMRHLLHEISLFFGKNDDEKHMIFLPEMFSLRNNVFDLKGKSRIFPMICTGCVRPFTFIVFFLQKCEEVLDLGCFFDNMSAASN
ncbi:MAG TPA: hypothetical protein VHL60_04630 [Oxalicibacterium sp.]|nr:hypothetical protein [Oxalicibacterium sp.]